FCTPAFRRSRRLSPFSAGVSAAEEPKRDLNMRRWKNHSTSAPPYVRQVKLFLRASAHLAFVGRRTIKTGHNCARETQVDRELATMVDRVVHHHAAPDGDAG